MHVELSIKLIQHRKWMDGHRKAIPIGMASLFIEATL